MNARGKWFGGRAIICILAAGLVSLIAGIESLHAAAPGEQNAPLGRAVIGGLVFATVSTLFFVPAFFSLLQDSRQHAVKNSRDH